MEVREVGGRGGKRGGKREGRSRYTRFGDGDTTNAARNTESNRKSQVREKNN